MASCSRCGNEIPEDSLSCPHCGKTLISNDSPHAGPQNEEESPLEAEATKIEPPFLSAMNSFGYILLISLIFGIFIKEATLLIVSSLLLLLGLLLYIPVGRLYLRGWKRSDLRKHFRPYIIGGTIVIGYFCVFFLVFYNK